MYIYINTYIHIYIYICNIYIYIYIRLRLDHLRFSWNNNYKMEVRKDENGNMENATQKFLRSHFLQDDHKRFLEDVVVGLIDKTQGSNPSKREY